MVRLQTQQRIFIALGIATWGVSLIVALVQRVPRQVSLLERYTPLYLATVVVPCASFLALFSVLLLKAWSPHLDGSLTRTKASIVTIQILLFTGVVLGIIWVFRMPPYLHSSWVFLIAVLLTPFLLSAAGTRVVAHETLLVIASLVISLVALELAMRAFPALIPRTVWQLTRVDAPYTKQPVTVWEHSGALNLPELSDVRPVPREHDRIVAHFIHSTNSLGFRGEGLVPNQVGLVGLGDSFTQAGSVPSTWVDLLGEELNLTSLNLGLSGRTTVHEIAAYLDFGIPRKPQVTVLGYFEGNDLTAYCPHDTSFGVARGRWDQHLLIAKLPSAFHVALDYHTRTAEEEMVSVAPQLETNKVEHVYPIEVELGGRVVELAFHTEYVSVMELSYEDVHRSAQFEAILNALLVAKEASERVHARFVVAYFPSKPRVYWPFIAKDSDAVDAIYADQRYMWQMTDQPCLERIPINRSIMTRDAFIEAVNINIDGQRDALRDALTEVGIEFVDLTPAFREAAARGEILYYPYDTHWNQAGHRLAADVIAAYLGGE